MDKKHKGQPAFYPSDLKIAIAREYLNSQLGYGALGIKHGFSKATIAHFVTWYRGHYPEVIPLNEAPDTPVDKTTVKQLAAANLKIAALEMLIQNAGKELGIDIVKKLGTKQSAK